MLGANMLHCPPPLSWFDGNMFLFIRDCLDCLRFLVVIHVRPRAVHLRTGGKQKNRELMNAE